MPNMYPHESTTYTDKTTVTEGSQVNTGVSALIGFISDYGRDEKELVFDDAGEFLAEFGPLNFAEQGAPIYSAYNFLQGGGRVIGQRLTAADANIANAIVLVKVKITPAVDVTPAIVDLRLTTQALGSLTSWDVIETGMSALLDETPDGDGYKTYPLFAFGYIGNGVGGNKFGFRITEIEEAGLYERRHYSFNFLSSKSGVLKTIEQAYTASLDEGAVDAYGNITFIEDIVSAYSESLRVKVDTANMALAVTEINLGFGYSDQADIDMIDVLFGTDHTTDILHEQVVIDPETVNLTALEGISLQNGDDGTFAIGDAGRAAALEVAYQEFYAGTTNKAVKNIVKYRNVIGIDANHDLQTKLNMASLFDFRKNRVFIDAGIMPSIAAVESWRKSNFTVGLYNVNILCQHYEVYDPHTKKNIKVPATFLLASHLPAWIESNGLQTPMAGYDAICDGFIEGTLKPTVEDGDDRKMLYSAQLNYIEDLGNGRIVYGTERTAQKKESDLSYSHNTAIMYWFKDLIEEDAPKRRYKFTEPDDLRRFTLNSDSLLDPYKHMVKQVTVLVSQSAYEASIKKTSTTLEMIFKDFSNKSSIDIITTRV